MFDEQQHPTCETGYGFSTVKRTSRTSESRLQSYFVKDYGTIESCPLGPASSDRQMVQGSIDETPSKFWFGVEQKGKIVDELTEYLHEMYSKDEPDLIGLRKDAQGAILKSQGRNLRNFEKTHKPAKLFEVGDLVVMKNVDTTVGTNKKFIKKYRGPYVIRKCLGNDRYVITDVENCQVTQMPYNGIVDSTRVMKWLEPDNVVENNKVDSEGNIEGEYIDYEYLEEDEEEEVTD